MDDFERTTQTVRTEETLPVTGTAEPAQDAPQEVVAAAPVYAAPVYAAQPVAAAPVYAAQPVIASTRVVTEAQSTTMHPSTIETARRVVTLAFGILQALIILRIVLLLLVANRDNGIVAAILNITNPFVAPFRDMFSLERIGSGNGSIFDFGAVVALIGWTLIEALVLAILGLRGRRRTILS